MIKLRKAVQKLSLVYKSCTALTPGAFGVHIENLSTVQMFYQTVTSNWMALGTDKSYPCIYCCFFHR